MLPTISLTVPCYNYARYLPFALDSILSQEGVDLDVTVIDDASTDTSYHVAHTYAERDPRVKVIRHRENIGHVATFNEGMGLATGKYFNIISADDVLTPGALKRAVDLMEKHPSVGLIYGAHVSIDDKGLVKHGMGAGAVPLPRRTGFKPYRLYKGEDWQRWVCQSGRCFILGSNAILRTSVQKEAGTYDARMPHACDAEMWLRVSHLSDVGYIMEDQLHYRIHDLSMMRTVHKGFEFDLEERRVAFQQAFGKRAISTENLIAAEHALNRILATGKGTWFHRTIKERIRHRTQRAVGVTRS